MKKHLLVAALLLFVAAPAFAGVNASHALVKVYKAWLSADGLCTNPVKIFDATADPVAYPKGYNEVDIASVPPPTFGQGTVPAGTYQCMIVQTTDTNTITPATSDGNQCVAGTQYTPDVCYDLTGSGVAPETKNPETGAISSCTVAYGHEDTVYAYFSTFSTYNDPHCSTCDTFLPPEFNGDPSHAIPLTAAIDLTKSNMTGTLDFFINGHIVSDVAAGIPRCGLDPTPLTFTTTATQ